MLAEFPGELLLKILGHLDVHSIRSALLGLPWLRKHTLLFYDKKDTAHVSFFDIPGLQAADWETKRRDLEQGRPNTALIALYEINLESTIAAHWRDAVADISEERMNIFLHIRGSMEQYIQFRCDTGSALDYQIPDLDRCFFTLSEDYDNYKHSLSQKETYPWDGLTLQEYVDGGSRPEAISRAAVVYGSGMYKSGSWDGLKSLTIELPFSDEIPLIHGLRAPSLETLKIHYCGKLPIFSDLDGVGYEGANAYGNTGHFELINCNTGPYLRELLVDATTKEEDYAITDMSFLKNFPNVTVSGTPDFLFNKMKTEELQGLSWIRSRIYTADIGDGDPSSHQPMCGKGIDLSGCKSFTFFTNIANTTLTEDFKFGRTYEVNIVTMAPGFEMAGEFTKGFEAHVQKLHLICFILGWNSGHPVLTDPNALTISYAPRLEEVVIEGFLWGPTKENYPTRSYVWPKRDRFLAESEYDEPVTELKNVVIRFVDDTTVFGYDNIADGNAICLWYFELLPANLHIQQLTISFIEGPRRLREVDLVFCRPRWARSLSDFVRGELILDGFNHAPHLMNWFLLE